VKQILIILVALILLATPILAAEWDACSGNVVVSITNNHPYRDMAEHDVNIEVDTTGAGWENFRGGIYVTDINDIGSTRFAREWWNETAFNSANTVIWTKTNVSSTQTDSDLVIYYDCGAFTPLHQKNNTITFYEDWSATDFNNRWTNSSSCAAGENVFTVENNYINISNLDCGLGYAGLLSVNTVPANYTYLINISMYSETSTYDAGIYLTTDTSAGLPSANMIYLQQRPLNYIRMISYDNKNLETSASSTDNSNSNTWYVYEWLMNDWMHKLNNRTDGFEHIGHKSHDLSWRNDTEDAHIKLAVGTGAADGSSYRFGGIELIKYFNGSHDFSYSTQDGAYNPLGITENSQTYNATIIETDMGNFLINFTFNGTHYPEVYANITYDGVDYGGSNISQVFHADESTSDIIFSGDVIIPDVPADTSKSFFWNITLVNSTDVLYFASTTKSQTVLATSLSICNGTSGESVLFNFTGFDEIDNSLHNMSFKATFQFWTGSGSARSNYSYSNITGGQTSYLFCYDENTTDVNVDATIEYYAAGYDVRNYYLVNNVANLNTQNFSLYLLGIDYANGITFHVTDYVDTPFPNVIIKAQRYDAGTNTYRVVAMGQTDDDGEAYIFLRKFDAWYRFLVESEAIPIYHSEQTQIKADDIYIRIVETTISTLMNVFDTIYYRLDYSNATNVYTLVYSDTTGTVRRGCLEVNRRHQMVLTEICNTCEESASATITCDAGNSTGSYIATFYIQGSPNTYIASRVDDITESMAALIGRDGLILALLLVGVMMLAALYNPVASLVSGVAGLILVSALGIVLIPSIVVGGLVVVVIILIFKLKT
jgi:hypothetical protein